jgi:annexin A7/11
MAHARPPAAMFQGYNNMQRPPQMMPVGAQQWGGMEPMPKRPRHQPGPAPQHGYPLQQQHSQHYQQPQQQYPPFGGYSQQPQQYPPFGGYMQPGPGGGQQPYGSYPPPQQYGSYPPPAPVPAAAFSFGHPSSAPAHAPPQPLGAPAAPYGMPSMDMMRAQLANTLRQRQQQQQPPNGGY